MKRIIIYGISMKHYETRRYIEKFLDDEYEILGYSDGHYTSDFLDHKPFFKPEDICEQQVDFVLVNCKSGSSHKAIQRNLVALGVPPEKIIRPTMFIEQADAGRLDLIGAIQNQYNQEKGLIFGLSYSLNGIIERNLDIPFYDCSWGSLDLYYNFRIYDYMKAHGTFTDIHTALWVFPYYYFDYDLSLTEYSMSRRCSDLWKLNDWHHYRDSFAGDEHIENVKMFAKKMTEFFQIPKYIPGIPTVYGGVNGTELLDPLWFANHEATVSENKKIFVEFFNELTSRGGNVILIIPPFYLNGFNKVSKAAFQSKKEKFYQILHELEKEIGKIQIFDYADRFAEKRDLFYEPTHLNVAGAEEFTAVLNDEVISTLS